MVRLRRQHLLGAKYLRFYLSNKGYCPYYFIPFVVSMSNVCDIELIVTLRTYVLGYVSTRNGTSDFLRKRLRGQNTGYALQKQDRNMKSVRTC